MGTRDEVPSPRLPAVSIDSYDTPAAVTGYGVHSPLSTDSVKSADASLPANLLPIHSSAPSLDNPIKNEKPAKRLFYDNRGLTIVALIIFFPIGLGLMWRFRQFPKALRVVLTGFALLLTYQFFFVGGGAYPVGDGAVSTDQYWDSVAKLNNLNNDELFKLKVDAANSAYKTDGTVNLREMAVCLSELSTAGMRGQNRLLESAVAVAQLTKITGRKSDHLASDLFYLQNNVGLAKDEALSIMLTINDIVNVQIREDKKEERRVRYNALSESMKINNMRLLPWLLTLSNKDKKTVIEKIINIHAAISQATDSERAGAHIGEMLAWAAGGDSESLKLINVTTDNFAGNSDKIKALLLDENGMTNFIRAFGAACRNHLKDIKP